MFCTFGICCQLSGISVLDRLYCLNFGEYGLFLIAGIWMFLMTGKFPPVSWFWLSILLRVLSRLFMLWLGVIINFYIVSSKYSMWMGNILSKPQKKMLRVFFHRLFVSYEKVNKLYETKIRLCLLLWWMECCCQFICSSLIYFMCQTKPIEEPIVAQ